MSRHLLAPSQSWWWRLWHPGKEVRPIPPGTPTPGSISSGRRGCSCPPVINNFGRHSPFPPDRWIISADCPLHNPRECNGEEAGE